MMNPFPIAAIPLLFGAITSSALDFSGSVLTTDGTPKVDVTVRLAGTGDSTKTGPSGSWTLGAGSTSAARHASGHASSGRIAVDDARLSLSFSGNDAAGRAISRPAEGSMVPSRHSARRASVVDTLVYSFEGRVFLRDTVSESRSGMIRTYDTTWRASIVYGYLTDTRDDHVYRTVGIGNQIWLAENLNFVPKTDSNWAYANSEDSAKKYGRLYQWATVLGLSDSCNRAVCSTQVARKHRGICPMGWHVPRAEEWDTLGTFAGRSFRESPALKSKYGWKYGVRYQGGDSCGFRALPSGERDLPPTQGGGGKGFALAGETGFWWNASDKDAYSAYINVLDYLSPDLGRGGANKSLGFSCRCVKD